MEETYVDTIINAILNPIMIGVEWIISFVFLSPIISVITYLILINIVAVILMKKDKQYAEKEKWRIKENTLLITALAGGSIGIYFGMYKYKHKTMHKKFTIFVPIIMFLQFAYVAYFLFCSVF